MISMLVSTAVTANVAMFSEGVTTALVAYSIAKGAKNAVNLKK